MTFCHLILKLQIYSPTAVNSTSYMASPLPLKLAYSKIRYSLSSTLVSVNCFVLSVLFVTKASGKMLAIYHGYTYYCSRQSRHTKTWQCTAWGKCKARFTVLLDNMIKKIDTGHTHRPPQFKIVNNIFYKI